MTVGDLRKALEGQPNDMPVFLEIDQPSEVTELAQAFLRRVDVECRCDGEDCLYLWGSVDDDDDENTQSDIDESMRRSMGG